MGSDNTAQAKQQLCHVAVESVTMCEHATVSVDSMVHMKRESKPKEQTENKLGRVVTLMGQKCYEFMCNKHPVGFSVVSV